LTTATGGGWLAQALSSAAKVKRATRAMVDINRMFLILDTATLAAKPEAARGDTFAASRI
jgi:hypothetical protein